MADFPLPLRHDPGVSRTDADLAKEAAAHFAQSPALQVVAELLAELRTRRLPWWTASSVRGLWTATDRMGWFDRRPDLRQQITSSLTGLVPRTARNKAPEFQGELIDAAIEDGDINVDQFDTAFDPRDLVVYGPAAEFWSELRNNLPWHDPSPAHQDLVVLIFKLLLTDKSAYDGVTRKPILSVLDLRSAIPNVVWQTHMPLEIRAAVDDARLRQERAGKQFVAVNEMAIATPKIICASIPLDELLCVLDAAERAMGLGDSASASVPTVAPTLAPAPTVAPTPAPTPVVVKEKAATPVSANGTRPPAPPSRLPTQPVRAPASGTLADEKLFDDAPEEVTDAQFQPSKRL